MSTRWGWFDSTSISLEITTIELSRFALFADEYMAALYLPHIDKELLFPSVNYCSEYRILSVIARLTKSAEAISELGWHCHASLEMTYE